MSGVLMIHEQHDTCGNTGLHSWQRSLVESKLLTLEMFVGFRDPEPTLGMVCVTGILNAVDKVVEKVKKNMKTELRTSDVEFKKLPKSAPD